MSILDHARGKVLDPLSKSRLPRPPVCRCPPAQKGRLGGCRPVLRWADHDTLEAACSTCQRRLERGTHRRRDQTHLLGLVQLWQNDPSQVDLDGLREEPVLLVGERPPAPEPPAPPRPQRRRRSRAYRAFEGVGAMSPEECRRMDEMASAPDLDDLLEEPDWDPIALEPDRDAMALEPSWADLSGKP